MTALNIASAQAYYGETNVRASLTTSLTTVLANPAESGKLYRVNEIIVSNIDGVNSADVTVEISRESVVYSIVTTVPVPADSSLPVIVKEISFYLEEGDSIVALASANGDLEISVSYEIYSPNWDVVANNGLQLYLEAADRNSYDSRENYVSYSNYNAATWSLIPVTGTGSLTTGIDDPFNGSRAVRLTANNNGQIVFRVTIPSFTPNGTDQYTMSVYVRSISGTGTVILGLADDPAMAVFYDSSLVTNQWVRVTYTGTPSAVAKTFLDLYDNASTNRVLDFYGAQIEKRSSATPLTETNGSAITTASTTWKDLTANADNGTLSGPIFNTSNNGTLVFDGVNDVVSIVKPEPNIVGTITVEFWIKFNSTTGSNPIHKGLHYTLYMSSALWSWADSSNYSYASFVDRPVTNLYFTGVWNHFVVTKDSSNNVQLYRNGVLIDTRTGFGSALTAVNSTLWLGGYSDTDTAPTSSLLNGNLSIVRIYDRALSSSEILQNFSAEKERFTNLLLYLDASNASSYPGSGTTWTNLSNIGINGTLTNGPTFNSANGGSIVFDGVDDYVTTGNQFSTLVDGFFAGSNSDWTVTTWFKPDITKVTDSAIVSKSGGTGGSATFVVWFNGTSLYTRLRGGTILTLSSSLTNTWYNVAITWDSRTLTARAYLNGSFIGTVVQGFIVTQAVNFVIGAANAGTNTFFKGNIAEVRIYDRTLSLSSVQSIFNSTKTKFGL